MSTTHLQIQNSNELFLLEVLVKNLKVDSSYCDIKHHPTMFLEVQFSELPCFDIHAEPAEISQNGIAQEGDVNHSRIIPFNCGKSCLFLMDPLKLINVIRQCPIVIAVTQQTHCSTDLEIIGQAEVILTGAIAEMVSDLVHEKLVVPLSEYTEDLYEVLDDDQERIGELEAFIRLTCLGRNVLTQVQLSPDDKFHFKKEPRLADAACKSCDKGRPGPAISQFSFISTATPTLRTSVPGKVIKTRSSKMVNLEEERKETKPFLKKEVSKEKRKIKPKPTTATKLTELPLPKKKKRIAYAPGPKISYPRSYLSHLKCQGNKPKVPAKHGWAWKTTLPEGLKKEQLRGWQPGYFSKGYLRSMRIRLNTQTPSLSAKLKKRKLRKLQNAKPTLHIVRKQGEYHITVNHPKGEQPKVYTYPAHPSDSDLELRLNIPENLNKPLPILRHQAQQFCESDFLMPKAKKEKAKKKGKGKGKGKGEANGKGKGKDKDKEAKSKKKGRRAKKGAKTDKTDKKKALADIKPKPWDNWIMTLKCKNHD